MREKQRTAAPSEDDLVRLMAEEHTFVTRPVVVGDDRATAGFSARRVDELLQRAT